MMERNLLVGNGINIQFGGVAYSSNFILKRMKYNSRLWKYDRLFNNKITGKEIENIFKGFVDIANAIIEDKYKSLTDNQDILDAIKDFQDRYHDKVKQPYEIMLEDWLLLIYAFFLKDKDLSNYNIGVVQGFKELLLDGIYNDGKIQEIYQNMNKQVKSFFKGYDKIFTLNYDNNIESLTHKTVFHLHGDFSVLHDSENKENVLGYIRSKKGELAYIPEMKHCFCNALLNFSGKLKYKYAESRHKIILESEKYLEKYKSDPNFINYISEENQLYAEMIKTKFKHPELKMATEYYFNELKNIEGQLDIIGMSPNNDAHIFDDRFTI